MQNEFNRLLDQVFIGLDTRVCLRGQTWSPQVDIYETQEAFIIITEMTGLKPDEIEIVVDRNHIKISGCRPQPVISPPLRVHQMEIDYGNFERAFHLPNPINPEAATATMEEGLLKIVLPRVVSLQTRIGIINT
jgi:HSP20 family protein